MNDTIGTLIIILLAAGAILIAASQSERAENLQAELDRLRQVRDARGRFTKREPLNDGWSNR